MKPYVFLGAVILLVILSNRTVSTHSGADDEAVIFQRPFGDHGQRLALVQGPILDKADFSFLQPDQLRLTERIYQVRLEVRTPNTAPIVLASYLRSEAKPQFDRGVEVLDALVDDREIALCLAEGNALKIWRISIPTGNNCLSSGPAAGVWSSRAAPYRITSKLVRASLSKATNTVDSNGELTLDISEQGNSRHFIFEAEGFENKQTFKLVRKEEGKGE